MTRANGGDAPTANWQRARFLAVRDDPSLTGRRVWVRAASPERRPMVAVDGSTRIGSAFSHVMNLYDDARGAPGLLTVRADRVELLPEFRRHVGIEALSAWRSRADEDDPAGDEGDLT